MLDASITAIHQQASARRPTGRKTVPLSPAAVRGLRTLIAASRDVVETIAAVINHDPCSRIYYDILPYCKRYPRTVQELARVLDAADETRFTDWPTVRRLILETHAQQHEARRRLAQQLQEPQPGAPPAALEGDTHA